MKDCVFVQVLQTQEHASYEKLCTQFESNRL